MKKYLILLLCFISLFTISCKTKYKTSTPDDGLLVNETTTREKQNDMKALKKAIQKYHVDYTHKLSEKEFEDKYNELYNRLGELSSDEFCFEIMKLLSLIGDNATKATLDSTRYANRYYLPFEVDLFEEGYIIYEAAKAYRNYIGYKIVKIENTEIDDVVNILKDYYSGDTVARQKYLCVRDIVFWDLLKAAKIVNSKDVKVTLEYKGTTEEVTFKAFKNSDYKTMEFGKDADDLISKYNDKYYTYEKADNCIYIQFNVCNEDPNKSVKSFVDELSKIANPDVFHGIILDLRNNPGGLQDTIYPLTTMLYDYKTKNSKAQVFVLTGAETTGVAVVNIFERMKDYVTVIGAPTGGLNNFYGDKIYYTLPNTLLRVSLPEIHFDFYKGDDISVYKPDILVTQRYEDYEKGIDTLIKTCQTIAESSFKN